MRSGLSGLVRAAVVCSVAVAACALDDFTAENTLANDSAAILRGTEARDRPEVCVVENSEGLCSGALVAPNVVLTAGHCVAGSARWWVSCPYSTDTATVASAQAEFTPTYPNRDDPSREEIDNSRGSDLGLIRLDRPLRETRVARVSFARVMVNTRVYAIGRVNNGVLAQARLYRSPTFALSAVDTRNSYWAGVDQTVIQSGDSGGPLFDEASGQLIGVNSAGVDASSCRRGTVCDEWALTSAAADWYRTTLQRFTAGTTAPDPPPTDACAASTTCSACTALPSCGWCANRCVTGTSSGGATCTTAAGTWAWTASQCARTTPTPPPPTDACASSTDCAACTARASCGWCDGRCQTGTSSGPNGVVCASSWAWLRRECM